MRNIQVIIATVLLALSQADQEVVVSASLSSGDQGPVDYAQARDGSGAHHHGEHHAHAHGHGQTHDHGHAHAHDNGYSAPQANNYAQPAGSQYAPPPPAATQYAPPAPVAQPAPQYTAPVSAPATPVGQYPAPQQQYAEPTNHYAGPADHYAAPSNQYGAPVEDNNQYAAPAEQYSAPATNGQYAAPTQYDQAPAPAYGRQPSTSYDSTSIASGETAVGSGSSLFVEIAFVVGGLILLDMVLTFLVNMAGIPFPSLTNRVIEGLQGRSELQRSFLEDTHMLDILNFLESTKELYK